MKNNFLRQAIAGKFLLVCGLIFAFAQIYTLETAAQTRRKTTSQTAKKKIAPKGKTVVNNTAGKTSVSTRKVTQINAVALRNLLKRDGANAKPLLVNFWATWCDPCREEFPELVKIDADYKGKIDFIVVSIDDLAEINRDVPKFLIEMKAEMPAYLLKTPDEEAVIGSVSKNWQGGMPFTVLFNEKGEIVYSLQGKVAPEILRGAIDKITITRDSSQITNTQIVNLPNPYAQYTYEKGKSDAQTDIGNNKFIILSYGMTPGSRQNTNNLRENYGIIISDGSSYSIEYLKGYNEVSKAEIKRKFGIEL